MTIEKPIVEKTHQLTKGSSSIGRLAGRAVTIGLAIESYLVQTLLVKVIFVVRSIAAFIFSLYLLQKERDSGIILITAIWLLKSTLRGGLAIIQLVALPIMLPLEIGRAIWNPHDYIDRQLKFIREHDERKHIGLVSYFIQWYTEGKLQSILTEIQIELDLDNDLEKEIQKFEDHPTVEGIGRLKRKMGYFLHPDQNSSNVATRYYSDIMPLFNVLEGLLPLFEREVVEECKLLSDID